MDSLSLVRSNVIRLERYCRRAKDKIWAGDRRSLINAMADVAEVAEIARRLRNYLVEHLQQQQDTQQTLQDEP